ncbi:AMP binding protein [Cytidiella melzeri]|nr:AMP binding protein [Cytidiella melzeri]
MQIYTSPYPPVSIRNESLFTHQFRTKFNDYPHNHPAFIDASTGFTITRAQLRDLGLSMAWGLRNQLSKLGGVQLHRGDVVMIFSPNSIAWPVMFYGGIAAGLRMTLANSAYTPRELHHQWSDSGAKAMFVHPVLLDVALTMFKDLDMDLTEVMRRIIIADWPSPASSATNPYIRVADLLGVGQLKTEEQFNGDLANETVLLCYSSGTTGNPKGVMTTHRNLIALINMCDVAYPQPNEPNPVMLAVLPLYHIYGIVKLLQFPWLRGMSVVLMSKFDIVDLCKNIEKYKVTQCLVVPPMCLVMLHHPAVKDYNMKSLVFMMSGAAPLGAPLSNGLQARLKSLGATTYLGQGYGLTETSPTTHILPIEDVFRKAGCIGPLIPNLEARLVIEDVEDAKEGEPGELWIRGPTGYLNNPEATKNAITPDGWFKTGDVAVRDAEGYFKIVDRRKELIKYKGFQVPPAELEAILLLHPDIVDCAVIGVESVEEATELPRAYVVHAKGLAPSEHAAFAAGVQEWIKSRVAPHKRLRGGVIITDVIPKSAAGKILRRQLRERAKKEPVTARPTMARL